jgi:DtxR family Mn-dependent transcriptional regulator
MDTLSQAEENYLKAIFKLCEDGEKAANTNAIATQLNTSAASVSDMIKRLAAKEFKLIWYEKHRGVTLTPEGNQIATNLVRKHRLWEVFLVNTLKFSWDEVHEIAEQLEHIQSAELIERLDEFLGRPEFDPHGDPIPDARGVFRTRKQILLSKLSVGESGTLVGVQEHSSTFLQYLDKVGLNLGVKLSVLEVLSFDDSMKIMLEGHKELFISNKVSRNLFVQQTK